MFVDRYQAGVALAKKLRILKGKNTLVFAIPRGGVVVGKAISEELGVPLDIIITRKLGAPFQPELAIGAVGPAKTIVLNRELIEELGVEEDYLKSEEEKQRKVIAERLAKYKAGKREPEIGGKTVILVDDGIATGATVEAAIKYLRTKEPKKLILAVPVMPKDLLKKFDHLVDKLMVLEAPEDLRAVGEFYSSFPQVTDGEVIQLLR